MKIIRQIHLRTSVVVVVVLVAGGSSAAYAATRSAAKPIGTGIVVIDTNLAYEGAAAAGTGMVFTSSGEVLTNNHVINGATSIKVHVPGTAHTYTARVLGYDKTRDVAVLQLQSASNLRTVNLVNSSALTVGSPVTAVGNANGTGKLTSASGQVTGLAKSITVQDDSGGTEALSGLIETNAALQPGDSGGPLLVGSGRVVGMDTAASTGTGFAAYDTSSDSYAIPSNTALTIARQILAGEASATLHIGGTAFLGVTVASAPSFQFEPGATSSGATIGDVLTGGAAATAGLIQGDVITGVDGSVVKSPTDLGSIILAQQPGDKISIAYTDATGQAQTATVTLASGPPQ